MRIVENDQGVDEEQIYAFVCDGDVVLLGPSSNSIANQQIAQYCLASYMPPQEELGHAVIASA